MMARRGNPFPRAGHFEIPDHELTDEEMALRARYWLLEPAEMKRQIFMAWLFERDRLGKDDRN